jgi:hypothetical protein
MLWSLSQRTLASNSVSFTVQHAPNKSFDRSANSVTFIRKTWRLDAVSPPGQFERVKPRSLT